jgi:undecaprenyl-diphosphatase
LPHLHAYTASFPSGHTTESTAIFLTVATAIATLEANDNTKMLTYAVATFAILAIGFSRVYLGMHWPTDVLGGWVLGTAWALVAWTALRNKPKIL